MNRIILSSISVIIGGSLIYIIEKHFISGLTKRNIKLETIIKNLMIELNKKNKKIQNLNKECITNKEVNEKEDTNPTLELEIDSSEMTTSDSYDSFEEVDQKNDEESDLSANDESDADTSLESAESSIVSSSKSESVDILSNVSISSID